MKNNTSRNFVLVAGAFATGAVTGLLLSPKSGQDNRKWMNQNARQATGWAGKTSRDVVSRGEEKFHHYSNRLKDEIKNSVSDLTKAADTLNQ